MKRSHMVMVASLLVCLSLQVLAQNDQGYGALMTPQLRSDKLGAPEHLRSYVVDGKLRLSLRDAVVLTLENNSLVRVQETKQILVVDGLLAVGEFGETVVDVVELRAGELVAKFRKALLEHAAAAVFAEHHIVSRNPDRFRSHNLVRQWIGHHAVLMDA